MKNKVIKRYNTRIKDSGISISLAPLNKREISFFDYRTSEENLQRVKYAGSEIEEIQKINYIDGEELLFPQRVQKIQFSFYNSEKENIENLEINLSPNRVYCVYYTKTFSDFLLINELIPLNQFPQIKGVFKRKSLPGILFLIGNLSEEDKKSIQKRFRPILRFSKNPITFEELTEFLNKQNFDKKFTVGEKIEIQEDPLRGEIGTILEIDTVKKTLYINLSFGLKTKINMESVKIIR